MIIFNSDLDNTLIYSYKHDIGKEKVCVEVYQEREISFMTDKSYALLKKVKDRVVLVPTTTRTMEQYHRIDLGIGVPPYALVCNGGVLLIDGEEDDMWYQESLALISDCTKELKRAIQCLESDRYRSFEVRNIRELFVFTKSSAPGLSVEALKKTLDVSLVDVFCNGVKVYVVPKKLSKGIALKRLQEKIGADTMIAAGDSEFDVSMLRQADIAIAPEELVRAMSLKENVISIDKSRIFSDALLEYILTI